MTCFSRALALAASVWIFALLTLAASPARATCPATFSASTIATDADCIFRDYAADGVPSSGPNYPQKSDLRHWGEAVGGAVSTALQSVPTGELAAFGAVGDGVTDNSVAFENAFAAIANGGKIHVSCGVFKITSTPSVTVAAGKHAEFVGDGQDCTVILISGAINGPTFNFGNQWSSVRTAGISFVSDAVGTGACLVYQGSFTNSSSAYAATSSVENVTFRGSDAYTTQTRYCGSGFWENGISNLNIIAPTYQGIPSRAGTAISLQGTGTGSTYSVQINISHAVVNNCYNAVSYGDWVQGVALVLNNVTGCNNGVVTPGSPSGTLSGLLAATNQFNTFICGICVYAANFNNLQVEHNQMIVEPSSIGVQAQGTNFIVAHNEINGVSTTGSSGLVMAYTFGNGGKVDNNHFANLATGITVRNVSAATVKYDDNLFQNNTVDYSIGSASAGTQIHDTQPRNYSAIAAQVPCEAATRYSVMQIADAATSTFNATVSVGGGSYFLGIKCDGSRWFVD